MKTKPTRRIGRPRHNPKTLEELAIKYEPAEPRTHHTKKWSEIKGTICECGDPAIERFAGKNVCGACLTADRVPLEWNRTGKDSNLSRAV